MKRSLTLVLAFLLGGGVSAFMQSSKDAVAVDPTHHNVIMDNARVRVFEVLACPSSVDGKRGAFLGAAGWASTLSSRGSEIGPSLTIDRRPEPANLSG
ncbi:MAG: hypothetical protein LC753_04665 [Acidobacteria bacterium]|nr:hypothetical protein [Acidobacteriota bacterium]